MNPKLQQGQTLIETLAALAIISVVIGAIGVLVTTSLSTAKYNQYQTLSTKYAQQGIEVVQEIRDSSYKGFQAYTGTYCLAKNQTTINPASRVASCVTPNYDNFIRSVTVQQAAPRCGANFALVTVTVKFSDGKCTPPGSYCHAVTNDTCLTTVDPVLPP